MSYFKLNLNSKIFLIFLLIIISFFRSPYIFLKGRFMAEDGELFFKSAFENNFLEHLFYFAPNSGYYNFIANILAEISTYFSLNHAPLVVAYGSLFLILLPIILILFKDSHLFKNDYQKVIASLILFTATPNSPEVWANSINSQIYLFFSSFLILYFKDENNSVNIKEKFLLLIAGLSGIYSCILTPIFFLKFYFLKKKNNLYNFIILLFCTIIQLSLIFYSKINNLLHTSQIELIEKPTFYVTSFIYSFFLKPIFGRDFLYFINENLYISFLPKDVFFLIFSLCILYFFIKFNFINYIKKDKIFQSIIFIYLLVLGVVFLGSDNFPPSGRYAVIPGNLFLLIIFYLSMHFKFRQIRYFFSFVILLSIISGIYEFRPTSKYIKFLDCVNCPDWKTEIINWKKDNSYVIRIWPYPRKQFTLNNE